MTTIRRESPFWDGLRVNHDGRDIACYKVGVEPGFLTLYSCEGSSGSGITGMNPIARIAVTEWEVVNSDTIDAASAAQCVFDMRVPPWELKR